jgi:hypothetical protein
MQLDSLRDIPLGVPIIQRITEMGSTENYGNYVNYVNCGKWECRKSGGVVKSEFGK